MKLHAISMSYRFLRKWLQRREHGKIYLSGNNATAGIHIIPLHDWAIFWRRRVSRSTISKSWHKRYYQK